MLRLLLVLLCSVFMLVPALAQASHPVPTHHDPTLSVHAFQLQELDRHKRELAFRVANALKNEAFRDFVQSRIEHDGDAQALVTLAHDYAQVFPGKRAAELATYVDQLDLQIRNAKGTSSYVAELLQVRLYLPEGLSLKNNAPALVAFEPSGDDQTWTAIEAFDQNGNARLLDAAVAPQEPVLIVGLDAKADLQAGLALLNDAFQAAGVQQPTARRDAARKADVATHKLDKIRLEDDQEPWISGDAEVYAIVNGVHPSEMKANITATGMPYLDDDEKNYYPNQILIFWDQYRYQAANIVLMEQDDNTNYQELAALLVSAVARVMATFPETAPYAGLVDLAGEIIRAMPASWFTNDDDYLDVYYTIEKNRAYTDWNGASGNARITLKPYTLRQN
ncbi:DUF3103 family protein [Acanthopleuribacter pedis]|uniref:DUF3103 family protein n=1 Tax=Acanthopleuribacter pedis TaxID=442870 RepID=A0A8J7U2Q9_9BACT|nr:DUF3103 family protein [Acanthopleuribacter pedis]MBO1319578.1 DUF3103 family protein [Acanthopleuribacter pedis]